MDKSILNNIRDIAFIVAIYLFFTGWVYNYFYLKSIFLSIRQFDFEFNSYFIYSFTVFADHMFSTVWLLFGLLFIFSRNGNRWLKYLLAVAYFPVLFYMARATGDTYALQDYGKQTTRPQITICFKDELTKHADSVTDIKKLMILSSSFQLNMIAEGKDQLFVLYPASAIGPGHIKPNDRVYAIDKKLINFYYFNHSYEKTFK